MKGRLLLLVYIATLLLLCTLGIQLIEYQLMDNEKYRYIWDCLYWTMVTISTVGFGDIHPIHTPGRIFTLFVIAGGVAANKTIRENLKNTSKQMNYKPLFQELE